MKLRHNHFVDEIIQHILTQVITRTTVPVLFIKDVVQCGLFSGEFLTATHKTHFVIELFILGYPFRYKNILPKLLTETVSGIFVAQGHLYCSAYSVQKHI